MAGAKVGYIRVSTRDQSLLRQLDGVDLDKVFEDTATGTHTKRTGWVACNEYLREGDQLHVHSIDRLARNLVDLQTIVTNLVSRGVSVHFHRENLVFDCNSNDPLQTLLLHVMGAFAQFERDLIMERQREGYDRARRMGKRFGRKSKLSKGQEEEMWVDIDNGVPKRHIAEKFGVSTQIIYERIWKRRLSKV